MKGARRRKGKLFSFLLGGKRVLQRKRKSYLLFLNVAVYQRMLWHVKISKEAELEQFMGTLLEGGALLSLRQLLFIPSSWRGHI